MQKMTWEEMKQQFPDEWLLITDFDTDDSGHLLSGVVVKHSASKKEIYQKPALSTPTAFRYTGESTFMGFRSHAEHDHYI
ncbi:MAG: hypothetical protein A3I05_01715 [Deltaproteobacteria bacterium RIFCSPLOWO2_02_FULL_44_10]|nr:MAG: hypothetical protein A3C46_05310 [Deltaproteobacteria bacterium RIFCSPHIGHO2_02_FULL_44_16]OGQ45366.1 MAG: hypothetical protein A3I05_01715 [Deltaproteobacteria bacterium RIFCSPLOWO2_02_FULL_44_10]